MDINTDQSSSTSVVTLWQFLLELLHNPQCHHIIRWTNAEGEFKLINSEEVARMWGLRKNKENMNYDKLSRALRYYYDKDIIKKVLGQKFVYRFVKHQDIEKKGDIFTIKMESSPESPYSPEMSHSPISGVPSPSGSASSSTTSYTPIPPTSTSSHQMNHHMVSTPPPPAHISPYLNPLAATQALHIFAAQMSSFHNSMLQHNSYGNALEQSGQITPSLMPGNFSWPEFPPVAQSPSPSSEDSKDGADGPLHLVTEVTSRRRQQEQDEERKRSLKKSDHSEVSPRRERSRSPTRSPTVSFSPITKPKEEREADLSLSCSSKRSRTGPKHKPSPLSIEAITHAPPIHSPLTHSACSLHTPVVSMPSPPYSAVPLLSPLAAFSPAMFPPFYTSPSHMAMGLSPRGASYFNFPSSSSLSQFSPFPPNYLPSPLIPTSVFDFSLKSPKDKPSSVPVLQ